MLNMDKVLSNIVISTLLLFLLTQIAFGQQSCDEDIKDLSWLEGASPNNDALNAIQDGDTKYFAIVGFAITLPGLENEESLGALESNNYKIIEGTTDDICSERHFQLIQLAGAYAETYNTIIKEYVETNL